MDVRVSLSRGATVLADGVYPVTKPGDIEAAATDVYRKARKAHPGDSLLDTNLKVEQA